MSGQMLSKFLTEGDKVEIQSIERRNGEEKPKVYVSSLQEIISDDAVEILMPMEQNKAVIFPVNGRYELIFYNKTGLYQCVARVIDRYRDNKLALLRMEFESNLRKYQRREYYRFSCALEMQARNLADDELQAAKEMKRVEFVDNMPMTASVVVDISGGGLRFMSAQMYEPGSLIYCSYCLIHADKLKRIEVVGKVLSFRRLENRPGVYEHRVQYYNIDEKIREDIIKYIFEEERKSRKLD